MLPRKELKKVLSYNSEMMKFRPGQVVCEEGEDSTKIYIVMSGEFEVSKVLDVNENDLPGARANELSD